MVNFNGCFFDPVSPIINANSRVLEFGDALFEELRVINGAFMFWEAHYFRLMSSMRILRMEIPMEFTMEFLEDAIRNTISKSGLENKPVAVTIIVVRRNGMDNTVNDTSVDYLIKVKPLDNPFFILDEKGLKVELFKDFYLNSDMLSNLNSNNKSINVVAQIYAQENGYDSCLLINTNKHVVQAIAGNLFMITANHIKTPPLTDGCIDGIVRKQLIELAMNLTDYQLEETSISPFELQKADELFIANDLTGINSIGNYRKKVYTNEVAKILVGQLNAKARLA
ncbi:MAG: aminotransferase class IV [Croceitalea sp.]|nr:aminotransferase class IV [Croceitalea sp.]